MRRNYSYQNKNTWEVGATVNVGFLVGLTVLEKIPTPGDFRPDAYLLEALNGTRYVFTPHCGIVRADDSDLI